MLERYIGIENEFKTFIDKNPTVFLEDYFDLIRNPKGNFNKTPTCIRTDNGLGYYIDQNEIEIMTPPVALNKGFSTRLTDLLIIGRDHLAKSTPKLEHTGYSIHWNLSASKNVEHDKFYSGIAVPIQMFGLTPLSGSFNVRSKMDVNLRRYEVLADSIGNEEQINATALMLGSYLHAIELNNGKCPFVPTETTFNTNEATRKFIPNGRYDELEIYIPQNNRRIKISVQEYMEEFLKWISPHAKSLGSTEEYKNLEAFILGEKQLEMDKFKYFSYLNDEDGIKRGTYLPIETCDEKMPGQILKISVKDREIPLEGKLLGEIVRQHCNRDIHIDYFDWDSFSANTGDIRAESITQIYKIANELNSDLETFKLADNLHQIKMASRQIPYNLNFDKTKATPIYNPNNDIFIDNREIQTQSYYIKKNLKQKVKKSIKGLIIDVLVGSVILYGINSAINNYYINPKVAQTLIEKANTLQVIEK